MPETQAIFEKQRITPKPIIMNPINPRINNNYIYQKSIHDYQNVKSYIKQGLKFLEEGSNQNNKRTKEDFITEKLVTNLNAGIGRLISSQSVLPSFGWGSGFFTNMSQSGGSKK